MTIDVTGYSVAKDDRGGDYIVRQIVQCGACSRSSRHSHLHTWPQVFIVKVKLDEFSWLVYRRFSQFRDLGEKVRRAHCARGVRAAEP